MCRTCCRCPVQPVRACHRPDNPCDPYMPLTLCHPTGMLECCPPCPLPCYPNCSQKNKPCCYPCPCKAHCYETFPVCKKSCC